MMIPRPSNHALLPLAAVTLAVTLLLAPASSLAAEEATTPATTETTTAPPEPPAASTPSASAPPSPPTTGSAPAGETAPAPTTTTTTAPPASAPRVSGQSAQGSTGVGRRGGRVGGAGKSGAANGGESSPANGGKSSRPHRGPRAPKPSALTPPLPLSLSSTIAGVPAFFIESFRIPPFLLPIYQAAGTAYGVPWQVLAAINEVETDYGRDLSVSSAGAEGWMQFLPSSWATYGVDANGDGFADPYNPADAIFAAARYLRAAGAATNLRGAIFSYNHSQAYVESVTLRAKLLGGTPSGLLGAITGLTESRFPVHARAHFSDGFPKVAAGGSPAIRSIAGTTIYSEADAPVIAVQDGQIIQIGDSPELGHFVSLRDAYGNTYTYAKLGSVAQLYPVLQPHDPVTPHTQHGAAAPSEPRPTGPASAGTQVASAPSPEEGVGVSALSLSAPGQPGSAAPSTVPGSAAQPAASPPSAAPTAPPSAPASPGTTNATGSQNPRVFRDGPNDVHLHDLRAGVQVIAGTVLGHVATAAAGGEPSMVFQVRPAGPRAPLIDPKPILDGWVQLENSSVFRAKGQSPFAAGAPSAGEVLLESKEQLERQVLANPDIQIYPCGRQDIETDQIDRRVLATLEFLAVSGLKPTVSALKCGHSLETAEGNVSEHSTGDAVDISAIDGVPIAGHQGPGSITDTTIRKMLTLQGSMKPHQIISLMSYPGADNTIAKADHFDHIHVGFLPAGAVSASLAGSLSSAITPSQWIKLIARLGEIPDPSVASARSAAAIPAPGARAGGGEG